MKVEVGVNLDFAAEAARGGLHDVEELHTAVDGFCSPFRVLDSNVRGHAGGGLCVLVKVVLYTDHGAGVVGQHPEGLDCGALDLLGFNVEHVHKAVAHPLGNARGPLAVRADRVWVVELVHFLDDNAFLALGDMLGQGARSEMVAEQVEEFLARHAFLVLVFGREGHMLMHRFPELHALQELVVFHHFLGCAFLAGRKRALLVGAHAAAGIGERGGEQPFEGASTLCERR